MEAVRAEAVLDEREERLAAGLSWIDRPRLNRRQRPSGDSEARVEKRKFFVPPSASKPAAIAMPSRIVDLPEPFSPTK